MNDKNDLYKIRALLKSAKADIERAKINAPVPLSLCLDLAMIAMSLARDIDKIDRIIDALDKDATEINIIITKTKIKG